MNKTILITGASTGIGKASALYFAERNWNVVATMRSPEKQEALKNTEHILVLQLDVEQPESINKAIGAGIAHFGKIDALLNNAGYGQHGIFEATSPEQIQKQFSVNLFGSMKIKLQTD